MVNFFKKKKKLDRGFDPNDIFIDTLNVSDLDTQQFEGVMRKALSVRPLLVIGGVFLLFFIFFISRLFQLQVIRGQYYLAQSQNNLLREKPLFAERGLIYDRNGVELAWNTEGESGFHRRAYYPHKGFGHLLGYVKYPRVDNNGFYWQKEIVGQDGLEKKYNEELSGMNGSLIFEVDAYGRELSKNHIEKQVNGENITSSIDAKLQEFLFAAIEEQAKTFGFNAGSGAIMDIQTGELLSMVSYPEYDPSVLSEGEDSAAIRAFFLNPQKPFLNRLINGLYSPGSTIKLFVALAALEEGLINETTVIQSTGRIEIPNKYNPNKPSIYRDWKRGGHGPSDVTFAIADSVNTFFYAISGGYQNQKGLGIERMLRYFNLFEIGQITGINFGPESQGVIPSPRWKKQHFSDGRWRLGDTYITAIGQFGFQASPLQMLRSVSALANKGRLLTPGLIKDEISASVQVKGVSDKNYRFVQDGLRQTVLRGTAQNLQHEKVSFAVKTGTAQVGKNNEFYNSWVVGFFPYEKPRYSFVVTMERGPRGSKGSASRAMKSFIDKVDLNYSDFWQSL